MFIEVTKLHKSFNENIVLHDVSFSIAPKARIGLVGNNGAGKSTLLKIIQGLLPHDEGMVHIAKSVSVAYVPQIPDIDDSLSVRDFLMNYTDRPYKAEDVLASLGIPEVFEQTFGSLSGGQQTKIYLARIALFQADVLLLDEPTNHLDINGLTWLQSYLQEFKGALVIISHDRYFLDEVTAEIFELEDGSVSVYGGNYSFYKEQKGLQQEAYMNQYSQQQKEIRRLKNASLRKKDEGNMKNMDRTNHRDNDKMAVSLRADRGSKKFHSIAKSIDSRIEHIETMEKPKKESVLDIYFKPSGAKNSSVVSIKDMSVGYDEELFFIQGLDILYGQHIALQGENGSGKTTLIKRILAHAEYDQITVGSGVTIGYLSQDHLELSSEKTALELLLSIEGIDTTAAYKILSQITISPDQMKQPLSEFSSGQKTKLLLAKIMATGANFIILDEPTNHLDFQSIDIIEQALQNFRGALLCISHDRYFLEQIGVTRYLHIQDKRLAHIKPE